MKIPSILVFQSTQSMSQSRSQISVRYLHHQRHQGCAHHARLSTCDVSPCVAAWQVVWMRRLCSMEGRPIGHRLLQNHGSSMFIRHRVPGTVEKTHRIGAARPPNSSHVSKHLQKILTSCDCTGPSCAISWRGCRVFVAVTFVAVQWWGS